MADGSYIGLHRKEVAAMQEITVKINCDTSDIASAVEAMNELAAAAEKVKVALDNLFGAHDPIVTNVVVSSPLHETSSAIAKEVDEAMASMKSRRPDRSFNL